MPTVELDAKFVETATPPQGKSREFYWDKTQPGFGLMVTADGARSFVIQYRNTDGRSRRMKINGGKSLASARREARSKLGDVAKGSDPLADKRKQRDARADTLRRVVEDEYLPNKGVKKLRSRDEKKFTFTRYIFPTLGSRPITEIKRSEIIKMLEKVEDKNGPGAANNAFKALRRFFNWYVSRADDSFNNPIVRGVWTQTSGDGARTLTDDEIRILWNVASEGRGPYDHFIRFTLLTATRLSESAEMSRSELSKDGMEWTIPEDRYKGQDGKSAHAHLIPLSSLARQVLSEIKVLKFDGKDSPWVFTSPRRRRQKHSRETSKLPQPISGFTNLKKAFDRRLHAALEKEGAAVRDRIIHDLNVRYPGKGYQPFDAKWTTHALRKTARTLLSRIPGINKEVREKCLGHVEAFIVETYDHHEFALEKRTAFEALAREIERIVKGKSANVVPLARA